MQAETLDTGPSKMMLWAGRILSALPVLMLIMSGVMKLTKGAPVLEGFVKSGYPESVIVPLGIVELASTLLYVIPQTSVLGAILLTGYLGGATASHVRLGEAFIIPVILGVLVWLGLFLRDARIRALFRPRRQTGG
ncbi:MAG: rane protein [Planctomycetota bacterium]|nr:rane protein [Planctomycetota bacterium]